MDRFWLLILIVVLMLFEAVKQLVTLSQLNNDEKFSTNFHNKLVEYVKSGGEDSLFVWLTQNAIKMQNYMGGYGVMSYQPPFSNYYINNYMIIINGLDEVKKEFYIGFGEHQHFELLRSAILKYSGSINMQREASYVLLKNPIRLFTASVKSVVLLPVFLLREFGILNSKIIMWIKNSYIMKFVSGIIALATIASTVITIVLGWDEFTKVVTNLFLRD